jgi:short-subunit dehydrogenase
MEGLGSNGMMIGGLSVYGTSKAALRYFTRSLNKEARNTSVQIGSLSPGMVLTELLTGQKDRFPKEWEKTKRLYNILANKEGPVTSWLVDHILRNNHSGVTLKYMTSLRMLSQLLAYVFMKRDLFKEEVLNK